MFAQASKDILTYKGGKFYLDGQQIEKSELSNFFGDKYDVVKSALAWRKAGFWELGIGTAALAAGTAWTGAAVKGAQKEDDIEKIDITGIILGPTLMVCGILCDSFGIKSIILGSRGANEIADSYNSHYSANFSFGSTPNGIGLALNF